MLKYFTETRETHIQRKSPPSPYYPLTASTCCKCTIHWYWHLTHFPITAGDVTLWFTVQLELKCQLTITGWTGHLFPAALSGRVRLPLLAAYQGSVVQRVNQFSSLKWHESGNSSACIVSLGIFFPCDYSHVVIKGMKRIMSVDGGERRDEQSLESKTLHISVSY